MVLDARRKSATPKEMKKRMLGERGERERKATCGLIEGKTE